MANRESLEDSATLKLLTTNKILNDLIYVGQYWNQTGYDLWEEVHVLVSDS